MFKSYFLNINIFSYEKPASVGNPHAILELWDVGVVLSDEEAFLFANKCGEVLLKTASSLSILSVRVSHSFC